MTNKSAIYLGLLLIGAIVLDIVLRDGHELVFLGRKFLELTEYLAFWR